MESSASEAGLKQDDLFARIEQLEAALESTGREADEAELAASKVETICEMYPAVRPYANSLFAYFFTPKKLPPVPAVVDEPEVEPIRSERPDDGQASLDPAYRDDTGAMRARAAELQDQVDRARTRLARNQQRLARAQRERARRAERALRDEKFSTKEWIQLAIVLVLIIGGIYACEAGMHSGPRW